jgi:hypothetical protein
LKVLREDSQANAGWAVSSEIKRWKAVLATPAVSNKLCGKRWPLQINELQRNFVALLGCQQHFY